MKTEKVKLSQVKNNADNPRTITTQKFLKLVNSILILPKMLELRPIVVTDTFEALGGNMRNNALKEISKMTQDDIAQRLQPLSDYQSKTKGERETLINWWVQWLKAPYAYVIKASDLTKEEQKQFIIKDNVAFGQWDYDMLANKWDNAKLEEWGMDVWPPLSSSTVSSTHNNAEDESQVLDTDLSEHTPGNLNIDEFFSEEQPAPKAEESGEVITIYIPNDQLSEKDRLLETLKLTLKDFENIVIK